MDVQIPSGGSVSAAPHSDEATSQAPTQEMFIVRSEALLSTLQRIRNANDNVVYRTRGGLRVMVRNDPDMEPGELSFDVSIVTENEPPEILKSIKNEIDIAEEDSGCIVIEEYSFPDDDADSLKEAVDFLNAVDLWTVCQCGEYLIKDAFVYPATKMCYYCEMTASGKGNTIFCPICHESGNERWMVATGCCGQKMHKKCREACIVTENLRSGTEEPRCPMCRAPW